MRFSVRLPRDAGHVELEEGATTQVLSLQHSLAGRAGLDVSQTRLFLGEAELADGVATLAACGVGEGAALELRDVPAHVPFLFKLMGEGGGYLPHDAELTDCVGSLRARVAAHLGAADPGQVLLAYAGRALEDDAQTVGAARITSGCHVQALLRPAGSPRQPQE